VRPPFSRSSSSCGRLFHLVSAGVFLISLANQTAAGEAGNSFDRPERVIQTGEARQLQPAYKIEVGLQGDIFPAFVNYASLRSPEQRSSGAVTVTISNPSNSILRQRVSVVIPGWSDEEVQIIDLPANAKHKLIFAPTFHQKFYENREIVAATVRIQVGNGSGHQLYSTTAPVRLRAAEDMFWGERFKYARFIASWVTPHDTRIEQILSRAKELVPGRRLPGYEEWKSSAEQEKSTFTQARAIYTVLQQQGVSYVKSSLTFGNHQAISQRIRTPRESIAQNSANCIDGAVLYASAFENLGMEPIVVLVPGHAYVGVKMAEKSDRYLYIDTAMTGRVPFEQAVKIADQGLARFMPSQITRISIVQAREQGIYPMPLTR
jgi:hypothetical protein